MIYVSLDVNGVNINARGDMRAISTRRAPLKAPPTRAAYLDPNIHDTLKQGGGGTQ